MHLFIYLEKRACEPDRHLHETVEIIIRGGKRQMAICNAYRQVAWRARPSHINKSGGRRRKPNQTNVATFSLPPSPALSFITHTHTQQRRPRREPTTPPSASASAIPPVRVALLFHPRRFRAIRGSPPPPPIPAAPHASRPPVTRPARRRPPWPPIPAKVPASSSLTLGCSASIRVPLIDR
jgi:hypothetical protein